MLGYLDCASGVSGDMFLGALVDAGVGADTLRERLSALTLPGWALETREVRRAGVRATLAEVRVGDDQPSRSYSEVERLLEASGLSGRVLERASNAFRLLAEAESRVHGVPVADVHFHEVGAVDSIVDILGVTIGLDELDIDSLWASPICVGSGTVRSEHGILPVPAPATAELLRGVPAFGGPVAEEMTTPTGAALLRACVVRYAPAPPARSVRIGYGAGSRDPDALPNVLRLTVFERGEYEDLDEQVALLETAVDHLSPEHLATALTLVLQAGALDVWQSPIVMKKGRLGSAVTVMAAPEDAARLTGELVRQTGSLGVRRTLVWRSVARRDSGSVPSSFGEVRVKLHDEAGGTVARPEADEVERIARETGLGVAEVAERLQDEIRAGKADAQEE